MRMGWDRHTDRKSDIMRILIHVHMYHPLKVCTMGHGGGEGGDIKKKSPITHKTFQIFFHIHVKTQFLKENLQIPAVLVCSQSLFVIVRKSSIVYDKNSSSWV